MINIPARALRPHPWLSKGKWRVNKDLDFGNSMGLGFEYILCYLEKDWRVREVTFRHAVRIYSGLHDLRPAVEIVNERLWRQAPWVE